MPIRNAPMYNSASSPCYLFVPPGRVDPRAKHQPHPLTTPPPPRAPPQPGLRWRGAGRHRQSACSPLPSRPCPAPQGPTDMTKGVWLCSLCAPRLPTVCPAPAGTERISVFGAGVHEGHARDCGGASILPQRRCWPQSFLPGEVVRTIASGEGLWSATKARTTDRKPACY
jgi:hypothetical protein